MSSTGDPAADAPAPQNPMEALQPHNAPGKRKDDLVKDLKLSDSDDDCRSSDDEDSGNPSPAAPSEPAATKGNPLAAQNATDPTADEGDANDMSANNAPPFLEHTQSAAQPPAEEADEKEKEPAKKPDDEPPKEQSDATEGDATPAADSATNKEVASAKPAAPADNSAAAPKEKEATMAKPEDNDAPAPADDSAAAPKSEAPEAEPVAESNSKNNTIDGNSTSAPAETKEESGPSSDAPAVTDNSKAAEQAADEEKEKPVETEEAKEEPSAASPAVVSSEEKVSDEAPPANETPQETESKTETEEEAPKVAASTTPEEPAPQPRMERKRSSFMDPTTSSKEKRNSQLSIRQPAAAEQQNGSRRSSLASPASQRSLRKRDSVSSMRSPRNRQASVQFGDEIVSVASFGSAESMSLTSPDAERITSSFRSYSMREGLSLLCYICGKSIPHAALEGHIEQCSRELDEALKVIQRNPLCGPLAYPQPPAVPIPHLRAPAEEKRKYTAAAAKAYSATKVQCRGCGKSFLLSHIADHFAECPRDIETEGNPLRLRYPAYDFGFNRVKENP